LTFSVASCLAISLNQMLAIRIIIGFGIGIIIPEPPHYLLNVFLNIIGHSL
jgi:hypothetical protein